MAMHCMPSDIRAIEDFKWCIKSPALMQFEDDQCWPKDAWFKKWTLAPLTTPKLTEYKLGLRFEAIVAQDDNFLNKRDGTFSGPAAW